MKFMQDYGITRRPFYVLVYSGINIPFIVLATTSHMIMLTICRDEMKMAGRTSLILQLYGWKSTKRYPKTSCIDFQRLI